MSDNSRLDKTGLARLWRAMQVKISDTVQHAVADKVTSNQVSTAIQEATSSLVSGIKGSSESSYRTGQVELTAANVGAAEISDIESRIPTSPTYYNTGSVKEVVATEISNGRRAGSLLIAGSLTNSPGTANNWRLIYTSTPGVTNIVQLFAIAVQNPYIIFTGNFNRTSTTGNISWTQLPETSSVLYYKVVDSSMNFDTMMTSSNYSDGMYVWDDNQGANIDAWPAVASGTKNQLYTAYMLQVQGAGGKRMQKLTIDYVSSANLPAETLIRSGVIGGAAGTWKAVPLDATGVLF